MRQEARDIKRKLKVLQHAVDIGHVSKACRYFGISRSIFYLWKKAYEQQGESGLINSKPCPVNIPSRTPSKIEEKRLHLRRKYHLGPQRITWFLERYHGIVISPRGVYYVLKRNGMNRLPRNAKKRTVLTHRYEKQVPGHPL
jgi:transposase